MTAGQRHRLVSVPIKPEAVPLRRRHMYGVIGLIFTIFLMAWLIWFKSARACRQTCCDQRA